MLVRIPAPKRTPATRPCTIPWDETSITQEAAPASTMALSAVWSASGPGVVVVGRSVRPAPSKFSTVPSNPATAPSAAERMRQRQ